MPTGYTADIKDDITFNQFVMNCARAFGALVLIRDEPTGAEIPKRFEPSSYNRESAARGRKELADVMALTDAGCADAAEASYQNALRSFNERVAEKAELRRKYEAMLVKVESWVPPSSDHHGLRTFMREQIATSIDFDCGTKYDVTPVRQSAAEWKAQRIASLQRSIEYNEKAQREEEECTDKRNRWIKQLRQSLR